MYKYLLRINNLSKEYKLKIVCEDLFCVPTYILFYNYENTTHLSDWACCLVVLYFNDDSSNSVHDSEPCLCTKCVLKHFISSKKLMTNDFRDYFIRIFFGICVIYKLIYSLKIFYSPRK